MIFRIISHDIALKAYVKSMWLIEHDSDISEENYTFQEYITFASAFPTLVFQMKGEDFLLTSLSKKSEFIPRNHFTGIIKRPIDIASRGSFALFGISFYPHVFKSLFNMDPKDTIDQIIDLNEVLPKQSFNSFFNGFSELDQLKEKVTHLLKELVKDNIQIDPFLEASISFILINKGQVSIDELARYLGYSVRHVERIFKKYIGISPKEYSNLLRFQNTINLSHIKEENNLTQLATFFGYSDQSHFIREFKKFTTLKPKDYFFNDENIGVGFVKYM